MPLVLEISSPSSASSRTITTLTELTEDELAMVFNEDEEEEMSFVEDDDFPVKELLELSLIEDDDFPVEELLEILLEPLPTIALSL